jgi:Fe-S oxidoreductase
MSKKSRDFIPPGISYIADNIISRHNVLGAPAESRASWAQGMNLSEKGETIFFAGCGYQYTAGLESMMSLIRSMDKSPLGAELPMSVAGVQKKLGIDLAGAYRKLTVKENNEDSKPLKAAVNVLRKLGIEFAYLGKEEPCCGGILHYAGMADEFRQNAVTLYEKFKSLGVKHIVGIVPSCTYTLARIVPGYIDNYDIKVKHFVEVVAENLSSLTLNFRGQVKVTYHDPCQLSRYYGLIEEPRQILKAIKGIELIEPAGTSREWSTCCGGGGGFEAVFPELSEILAVNRVEELLATGAEIIVSHCPGCIMQIKDGLRKLNKEKIQVMDLAEIIDLSLGA